MMTSGKDGSLDWKGRNSFARRIAARLLIPDAHPQYRVVQHLGQEFTRETERRIDLAV
jgi:hypothetical protein